MTFRRAVLFLALSGLLISCSHSLEPGLYQVRTEGEEQFLRVFMDTTGTETAVLYKNTGSLMADTLLVDPKTVKEPLSPYEAPAFERFPERDLYRFPQFEVGETKDVIFGRILRDREGARSDANLTMDLYYPLDDGLDTRPLLVTFHGGAFRAGDKRDTLLVEWNRHFASLGYVVSSVNYRLGYRNTPEETDDAMFHALRDANAAVRFLLRRDSLLIHSGRIFAAGADAGAITALSLAYFREENFPETVREEGDSVVVVRPSLVRGFDIRAVANLWGAVPDTTILTNAAIPVISFQDRNDPVIPYGKGFPFDGPVEEDTNLFKSILEAILSVFVPEAHPFREMYGAGTIHRILRARGVPSELHAFSEGRHDLLLDPEGEVDYPRFDEIKDQTARFFASKMVSRPVSLRQDPEDEQRFLIDDTEVEECQWQVEGGVLLGKSSDMVRILLFPDAPKHSVSVTGVYTSGLTFYETVAL